MSRHRAAMLIADLTGARPSTGFVHGILRRCAHALGEVMTLWPEQASRALRALIGGWHQALGGGQARVPADVTGPLVSQFRHAVRVVLSQAPSVPGANAKQLPGRSLLECLRDRQDDLLRFCSDTRVWPTNNISERDLRPLKTQQKISGRLQSADVTRDRLTIRGYISTAAKHRVDIMTALRDAMTHNPWTPPFPAPT
jgi:transposase